MLGEFDGLPRTTPRLFHRREALDELPDDATRQMQRPNRRQRVGFEVFDGFSHADVFHHVDEFATGTVMGEEAHRADRPLTGHEKRHRDRHLAVQAPNARENLRRDRSAGRVEWHVVGNPHEIGLREDLKARLHVGRAAGARPCEPEPRFFLRRNLAGAQQPRHFVRLTDEMAPRPERDRHNAGEVPHTHDADLHA